MPVELLYKDDFFGIKKACIEVRKVLGNGFLEKVYERALSHELSSLGFSVQSQVPVTIDYKGTIVGNYIIDLVVNDKIIIELKCVDHLSDIHKAQTLNYLKATGYKLGILINFPNRKKGLISSVYQT